jgi:hypothetical protein
MGRGGGCGEIVNPLTPPEGGDEEEKEEQEQEAQFSIGEEEEERLRGSPSRATEGGYV